MGCDKYVVRKLKPGSGTELGLQWTDFICCFADDGCSCLCTFPHNGFEADELKSLALLGAAIVLAEPKPATPGGSEVDEEWMVIPDCIPSWIKDRIDSLTRV